MVFLSKWLKITHIVFLQEWGLEGYQLWLVSSQTEEDDSGLYETIDRSHLIQLQFVKSALTVNPCMVSCGREMVRGQCISRLSILFSY